MDILFVSDYVCPYCLVVKEALKQALEATGLEARITWQPYELTPEPRERVDTYHDEVRKARYQILVEPCRQLGLDMKLPPAVVPRPYTRLAFEGWYYACAQGKGEEYNDLIYRAYFTEEQDIGQISVLAGLAERIGLDPRGLTEALEKGSYSREEQAAVRYARETLDIHGVPTLYIDGEQVRLSRFTKEELTDILTDRGKKHDGPGYMCGENGCRIR